MGPRRAESYERRGDSFEGKETSRRRDDSCGRDYVSFREKCSPRLPSPSPPNRRMWSREQQPKRPDEKAASFVVLTDKVEINNNRLSDCGGGESRRTNTGCGKEQKWMPPWYEPPM